MKKLFLMLVVAMILAPNFAKSQGCGGGSSSEDGPQIIGYIQPSYESQFLGDSVVKTMNGLSSKNSFYFNRARLGVTGNIPYDFSYYFMAEFSPSKGGPEILDAFITYKRFAPYLKISLGQFKSQFGLELTTACQGLYTVDRSRVVNELASPFRDAGIMFLGSTGDKKIFGLENEDIFSYAVALTNGAGMNVYDGNDGKDYSARLVFSPIEGIGIGGSVRYGEQKPIQASEPDDKRFRVGADLSVKVKNFLLQGEYILGEDKGSSLVGGGCGSTPTIMKGNFTKDGAWGSIMYTYNEKWAPIVKFQYYHITSDLASVQAQFQREFVFGLNYYYNDWTRFQVNYVITKDNLIPDEAEYAKSYLVFQVQAKFN
jgi:phosphate-selective porin